MISNSTAMDVERLEVQRIAANVAHVRERIAAACARVGRDSASVTLLPVTKTIAAGRLRAACAAGLSDFGENKVQEAQAKAAALSDLPVAWSIIGHLQTNKAKHVARFAAEVQSLDSLRLAEALDRRLQSEGRHLDVFIQVNSSNETSKYGVPPERVGQLLRELPAFSALKLRGLMTLAVLSPDQQRVRACFRRMYELRHRLRDIAPANANLDELSMGMSGDFEIAVEEGATIVRIGQAIFGPRPTPDSFYWPDNR